MSTTTYDAVLTITEAGINSALRQLLRWRNPTLFPYRKFFYIDLLAPPLTLEFELELPEVRFDGSSYQSGIEMVARGRGAANDEEVFFRVGIYFDLVVTRSFLGLRFRDLSVRLDDDQGPIEAGSLAGLLRDHLGTLGTLLEDTPVVRKYLQTVPLFYEKGVRLGPEPALRIDLLEFGLDTDSEWFLAGSNEVQLRGKVELLTDPAAPSGVELATFGVPYLEGLEEGDRRPIGQHAIFKWPAEGQYVRISAQAWEIDPMIKWDNLFTAVGTFLVKKDSEGGPRLARYKIMEDGHPEVTEWLVEGGRYRISTENFHVIFGVRNQAGRAGHFLLPADGIAAEGSQLTAFGVERQTGALSIGLSLWPKVVLRYEWDGVRIDPAAVDPEGEAHGFRVELQLAGRTLHRDVAAPGGGWDELPGGPESFDWTVDQRLATGEPGDPRYYELRLLRYADAERTTTEPIAEVKAQVPLDPPETPYDVVPELGLQEVAGDGFGVRFRVAYRGRGGVEAPGLPLVPVDPGRHLGVALSERFFARMIELHDEALPRYFVEQPEDGAAEGAVDVFFVVERVGPPRLEFGRPADADPQLPGESFPGIFLQQAVRIRGYVHVPTGLFSGTIDTGDYPLQLLTYPKLATDGYRTRFWLDSVHTNAEGLVARLMASYGDSLSWLEKFIFAFFHTHAKFLLAMSEAFNWDGMVLASLANDALAEFGDDPADFYFGATSEPPMRRLFWSSGDALESVSFEGRAMSPTPIPSSGEFTSLASHSLLNQLYWIQEGEIWTSTATGGQPRRIETGSGAEPPIGPVTALALDAADPGQLYWAAGDRIFKGDRNGSAADAPPPPLVEASAEVTGLRVDSRAGRLLWTTADGLHQLDLGKGVETTLMTGLASTSPPAFEIGTGRIFWTDHASDEIQSLALGDGGPTTLVAGAHAGTAGLQFDPETRTLYWHDSVREKIMALTQGEPPRELASAPGLARLCLHAYPGVRGLINVARGLQIGFRPDALEIGSDFVALSGMFEASMGADVFGRLGPKYLSIGLDPSASPLGDSALERQRLRRRLLDWMEFANLAFDFVPIEDGPWVKVLWKLDPEATGSVGSIQGLWDDGVELRLNPYFSWRAEDRIGVPNPENRLSYDFWLAHMLGHALGIYNHIDRFDTSQDDLGPVMQDPEDLLRDDYNLRLEDVHAIQRVFGARPIPFRPQVPDGPALEASMRNALAAIAERVSYRPAEAAFNRVGISNGKVTVTVWTHQLQFSTHEDSGDSEYEWLLHGNVFGRSSGSVGSGGERHIAGNIRDYDYRNWLAAAGVRFEEIRPGNVWIYLSAWIKSKDGPEWLDPHHEARNEFYVYLNRIGGSWWSRFIRDFENQDPSYRPASFARDFYTGLWVREGSDPFDVFVVYRVRVDIPGDLNNIYLNEKVRAQTELALKQALPSSAAQFVQGLSQALYDFAEERVTEVRVAIKSYVEELLDSAITQTGLTVTDRPAVVDRATELALGLYRAAYPEPGDRERQIFEQVVREELQDIADQVLRSLSGALPDPFRDALVRSIVTQNSPTALGLLRDAWPAIREDLFAGIPYHAARRVVTPRLEALRPQAVARAVETNAAIVERAEALGGLPSRLELEASSPRGASIDQPAVAELLESMATAIGEHDEIRLDAPEWLPLGTSAATVEIRLAEDRLLELPLEVEVTDSRAPRLTLPVYQPLFCPADHRGIAEHAPAVVDFVGRFTAEDEADEIPTITPYLAAHVPYGFSDLVVAARDESGNRTLAQTRVLVAPTRYVAYARREIRLAKGCRVISGFLGVDGSPKAPPAGSGETPLNRITIGEGGVLEPGTHVYAERLALARGARVALAFGEADKIPESAQCDLHPLPVREIDPFPIVRPASPGTESLAIDGRRLTAPVALEPGDRDELETVNGKREAPVVLELAPGIYGFRRLHLGASTELRALGPVELRISETLHTSAGCKMGGETMVIAMTGAGGETGEASSAAAELEAVHLGARSQARVLLVAPGRRVMVGEGSEIMGAIYADEIRLGKDSGLRHDARLEMQLWALRFLNRATSALEIVQRIGRGPAPEEAGDGAPGLEPSKAELLLEARRQLPGGRFASTFEVASIVGPEILRRIVLAFELYV